MFIQTAITWFQLPKTIYYFFYPTLKDFFILKKKEEARYTSCT